MEDNKFMAHFQRVRELGKVEGLTDAHERINKALKGHDIKTISGCMELINEVINELNKIKDDINSKLEAVGASQKAESESIYGGGDAKKD